MSENDTIPPVATPPAAHVITPIGNISDIGAVLPEAVPAPPAVFFKEAVGYLPVEADVDLAIEQELATGLSESRAKGYRMYLEGKTPGDIAVSLFVSPAQVLFWAEKGGWVSRLKERNDAQERLVRENLRALRLASAPEEAVSSLKLGRRIREVAQAKLSDDKKAEGITPMGLMNLANAGKAGGELGAIGMGDADGGPTAAGGRQPLVMIFKDGMPPVREKTIHVD